MKLKHIALAAAFALSAAPALAATNCELPPGAPQAGPVPAMPAMPSGVTEAMVLNCEPSPGQSAASLPPQCREGPLGGYMAMLLARHTKIDDLRAAVANWRTQADAYAACVLQNYN